jgi:tetratricopeptide (TPR) repeat protein
LVPDAKGPHSGVADALLLKGQFEAALAEYRNEPSEPLRLAGLACAHYALGQEQESEAALNELIENHQANEAGSIAIVFVYRGQFDRAFEWLYKEFATFGPLEYASTDSWLKDLRGDSRWLPFLRKMGKAPKQMAAIKFELKVPTH